MSVEDLIRLMEARLAALNSARGSAAAVGDVAQVTRLDADIAQTQTTLDQLRTLV
jgi:hypothetical protein